MANGPPVSSPRLPHGPRDRGPGWLAALALGLTRPGLPTGCFAETPLQAHAAVSRTGGPCPRHRPQTQRPTQASSLSLPFGLQWRKFSASEGLRGRWGPGASGVTPVSGALRGPLSGTFTEPRHSAGSQAAPASPTLTGSGEQKPPASPSRGSFPKASERWRGALLGQHSLYYAGVRPRASDGLVLQQKWPAEVWGCQP